MNDAALKDWVHYRPLSREQLFTKFHASEGTSKHLLILYSLVIGLRAKVVVELGLGQSTGALRAAGDEIGATLYTCDFDRRRFEPILAEQDERWKLYLEPSSSFLAKVPEPIDLVMHDGAHDYVNVRRDLETILPKMRKFGIICLHDTQQFELASAMLAAISDATAASAVSITNLPFNAGLAIIRVESSPHPPISPASGTVGHGRVETELVEFATVPAGRIRVSPARAHLMAAKIRLGHLLRQAGWRS